MEQRTIKKEFGLYLTVVCVVIVLSGCGGGGGGGSSGGAPSPTPTGNISGYVYVPIGGTAKSANAPAGYQPLQGADVTCEGKSTQTNTSGYYILTGIPAGSNRTVIISKSGYGTITKTGITVNAGQTTIATAENTTEGLLTLKSSGSISVTSSPASATIYIDSTSTGLLTPRTLDGISVGTHSIYVSLENYIPPATQTVSVSAGAASSVSFTLTPYPCFNDTDCDDGNDHTKDTCDNPGSAQSLCSYENIPCLVNSDCDDGNDYTEDVCRDSGTPESSCGSLPVECVNAQDCDDGQPLTIDSCAYQGTSISYCINTTIACNTDSDCTLPTPYCRYGGTTSSQCVECTSNSHCGGGEVCYQNECTPIACNTDTDCSIPTPYCTNGGTTSSQCVECISQSQCGEGEVCYGNECTPMSESCDSGACRPEDDVPGMIKFFMDVPGLPYPPVIKDIQYSSPLPSGGSFTVNARIEASTQRIGVCYVDGARVDNPFSHPECCDLNNWKQEPDPDVSPNPPSIVAVKLYYYMNGDTSTTTGPIDMTYDNWTKLASAQVPVENSLTGGDTITFYIVAVDHLGNVAAQVPDTYEAPCSPGTTLWQTNLATPQIDSCTNATQYEECSEIKTGTPSCSSSYTTNDRIGDTCGLPDAGCSQTPLCSPEAKVDIHGLSAGVDSSYLCFRMGLGGAPPPTSDDPPIERYTLILFNPDMPDTNPGDWHFENAFAITYAPEAQGSDPTLVRVLWDMECVTNPNTPDPLGCKIKSAIPGDTDLSMGYADGGLIFVAKKSWGSNQLIGSSSKLVQIMALTEEVNLSGDIYHWVVDASSGLSLYHKNTTVGISNY